MKINIKDLQFVVEKLNQHHIQYSLGGSGLLFSLGLVDHVNDWDIVVECSKEKLIDALDDLQWTEAASGDYPFASKYRIQIPSMHIDVIGSFALQTSKDQLKLPIENGAKWQGIDVSSPEIWYVAYRMMGREQKAEFLLNYLKANGSNKPLILALSGHDILDEKIKLELMALVSS